MDIRSHSTSTPITNDAPIKREWTALTDPNLVQQYRHCTIVMADWRQGISITWRGAWHSQRYEDKGTVLIYGPCRLSFTHLNPLSSTLDFTKNYHVVTCDLAELDGQMQLTLMLGNSQSQADTDNTVTQDWQPVMQAL